MGCDIHLYREKLVDGVWVTADEWEMDKYDIEPKVPYEKQAYNGRNYDLFGLLAGVRNPNQFAFTPNGVPINVSISVKEEIERRDGDGHTHSYLTLKQLKEKQEQLSNKTITISGMKDKHELKRLLESIESGKPDWSLLYPYCKWSNIEDYESFSLQVPVFFALGRGLQQIIDSFNGIDGEDHRIVFFFDN